MTDLKPAYIMFVAMFLLMGWQVTKCQKECEEKINAEIKKL